MIADFEAALAAGQTVVALDDILTTQEAADLLGVSRPTVVRLIDEGTLPATEPAGSHRRLRLADVLAYREARNTRQSAAFDRIFELEEAAGGEAN